MLKSFLIVPLACAACLFAPAGCAQPTAATPASSALEVRYVQPPDLSDAHLGKRILCERPMRHGAPRLCVEQVGDKVVAHDYGHGGSGWTLAPGSAEYVDGLLISSPLAKDLRTDTPITVIGAGVIGLFTAYDLCQKGYTNITVMAERFDGLTSHNAGGLLAPVSMDNDATMQAVIERIGLDAYRFYAQVARGEHPHFKTGAVIVPAYFDDRKESGLEPYVGKVMKPAKDVILDFGTGTTRRMVAYDDGIFIDTAVMMQSLTDWLKPRVKFVKRKVERLSDVETRFIVDCAGLGAGALNGDAAVVPVQGHLVMLKDQDRTKLQHMILVYFGEGKTASGMKVKRSFYQFPKHLPETAPGDVGVVGGTFIEGAGMDMPNEDEFRILIENARKFYGLPR
jgi:D-amino-acid oxidase